jgi:methylated-DNA-[protein]-cysteine S-methyltransferase
MSTHIRPCEELEPMVAAVAAEEADEPSKRRVAAHVAACTPCRVRLERYRDVEAALGAVRRERPPAAPIARARADLHAHLADVRSRLLTYRIFASPLGSLLIARSERGVALVEYLDRPTLAASRLRRLEGVEAVEDGAEIEALYRELLEYLAGRRTRLDWPLDLRFARGDFDRTVLAATERIPYGAVRSYAGIAHVIGRPTAVRAVAQALRWNPVPIAVPCHRVVGTSGDLTGYAGHRVTLKEHLLTVEGVHLQRRRARRLRVEHGAMYVADPEGGYYCLPTCPTVARDVAAKLAFIASPDRARAAGLAPCEVCRPDLHPLAG